MEGFDDPGVFFSDNFGVDDNQDELRINRQQIKNRLREFIRQFHEGNFTYTYRLVTRLADNSPTNPTVAGTGHWSEGSPVRRVSGPKGHWSEKSLNCVEQQV